MTAKGRLPLISGERSSRSLIGRAAFLRDCACPPGDHGTCIIVALSRRGPEWVIVEWDAEHFHNVSVVKLDELRVP